MWTRRQAILGASAALTSPSTLQARQAQPDGMMLFLQQNRYLPRVVDLRASDPTGGQILTQALAMIGEERAAKRAWEQQPHLRDPVPDLREAVAADALETIVAASRGRRVVILNEAHHISAGRLFLRDVARVLRGEGFDVLAAETFTTGPNVDFAERYAAGDSLEPRLGHYIRDPVFAETLRQAARMGYRFAAYEDVSGDRPSDRLAQIVQRETGEAANLARLLRERPSSRFLVYCGFSHAAELPVRGSEWMARRLRAAAGVDPLTIEQSQNWPGSTSDRDETVPGAVLRRFTFDRPICVSVGGRPVLAPPYDAGAMDLSVFHPRLPDVDGRPGWWARDPARRRTPLSLPTPTSTEALLQAQPAAESADAVPADQMLLSPHAAAGVLYLRPGAYRLRLETMAGYVPLPPVTVPA